MSPLSLAQMCEWPSGDVGTIAMRRAADQLGATSVRISALQKPVYPLQGCARPFAVHKPGKRSNA
jgi:hypothetical protein